jgi:hypothetical protein
MWLMAFILAFLVFGFGLFLYDALMRMGKQDAKNFKHATTDFN